MTVKRIFQSAAIAGVALIGAATLVAAPASGFGERFGIERFDVALQTTAGEAYAQGGGHPDEITTDISFVGSGIRGVSGELPDGSVKDLTVSLPAGFIGNAQAVPACSEEDLLGISSPVGQGAPQCAPETQVGVATLELPNFFGVIATPVYNVETPDDLPAQFGFNIAGQAVVHLMPKVRTATDYGLDIVIDNVSEAQPLKSSRVTLWGVPFDSSHDPLRMRPGAPILCLGPAELTNPMCIGGGQRVTMAPRAFLTTASDCAAGPFKTQLRANSWQRPAHFASADSVMVDRAGTPVSGYGCERLPFDPTLSVQPRSTVSAEPAGYGFRLRVPLDDNPRGLASATIRRVVVTLPDGVAISPSSATGLGACAEDQIGIGNAERPTCPESSKVGSVSIETPLLSRPMAGSVYLAKPTPTQLIKVYIVAEGSGVLVKLPGTVDLGDRITATFDNLPQIPFSDLLVTFKDGPRAPLSNPIQCGTATTSTTFTGWNGARATSVDRFEVSRDGNGAPCPRPSFSPQFRAGSLTPAGGADTAFSLTFSRTDQDGTLRDIDMDLPQGLTGRIANVPLCPDALANAGSCDESSRIGSTTTAAGPGSNPYVLPGRVYMTGPYKGAPFGMSIVVPAVAGPFDLGLVVVRAAVFVDRTTSALRVQSDPLPTALQGIPLQIRLVNVLIERERFMVNPTNCTAAAIGARIGSAAGALANVSSRFQAANCARLPFRPSMALRVGARGRTRSGVTTPFSATLRMTPGQANNRSVRVTLPKALNSRLRIVNQACTLDAYRAGTCGARARIGQAVAVTPLLRDPLRGSAYFVRNPARRLPDIMVALKGQVEFDLTGKVSIPRDLTLTTDFDLVPDVPITMFRLDLVSGENGPIGVVQNLCSARTRRVLLARLELRAQSGRLVERVQRMRVAGCGKAARTRRADGSRRARRDGTRDRRAGARR